VEVRHGSLDPLVLDCGTGAKPLGQQLLKEPGRALDLVFSHFHMDHLFGFPFFAPIFVPGYELRLALPAHAEEDANDRLGRYLNGVYHPVRLRDLPATLTYTAVRSGRKFTAGGYTIHPLSLHHPGGSLGYRIEADGQRLAYVTDTAPFAKPGEGIAAGRAPLKAEERVIELLRDCDLVLYDTMYSEDEYLEKMAFGHSYPEYAIALCKEAGVKTLALFHHLPDATDEQLDALEAHWRTHVHPRVIVAKEGEGMEVGEV
jgi:ribonuclease BN (tRNA processing enzyme)